LFRVDTFTQSGAKTEQWKLTSMYDTYVQTTEDELLHFDVLLPSGEGDKATRHARDWLQSIGRNPDVITLEKCAYCHTETATPEIERQIDEYGYFILQMEGCPAPIG
jgi:hypothetical protein